MSGNGRKPKDDLNVPTHSERLYRFGSFFFKATAGALADPSTSAVLNETFDLIVTDPGVRRRDRFITALDERLTELEEAGLLTAKDLENNEEVSALLLRSIQAATRSSGARKLNALKEVVIRGVTSEDAAGASNAQVMLTLVDRMTEHHIIALHCMTLPKLGYRLGQVKEGTLPGVRESFHYGQPVQENPDDLRNPAQVFSDGAGFALYVEQDEKVAFEVAEADLRALGLVEAYYGTESYRVGRTVHQRPSAMIAGYKISRLGLNLLSYMGITAGKPTPRPENV